MLEIWLDVKTTASWTEIYNVIDSPAVSGRQAVIKGGYAYLPMAVPIFIATHV